MLVPVTYFTSSEFEAFIKQMVAKATEVVAQRFDYFTDFGSMKDEILNEQQKAA